MRTVTTADKVLRLIEALGHGTHGPGRVYLTGGATAVLFGWRDTTIDVDLKLDPEPPGAFEAIARLKDELDINVELASPDLFVPPVPGWEKRSLRIATFGGVEFFHYDPIGQSLAKLERGHARDVADVRAMVERGLVEANALLSAFDDIRPLLPRYPGVDVGAFEQKVRSFVAALASE